MDTTKLLRNSFLCRLCGEENTNATNLFSTEENKFDLSELINKYLPVKVENDGKMPTKICPGCNIQLEATKLFMDLIITGQKKLRELYKNQQTKLLKLEKQRIQLEEALKNVNPTSSVDTYTIHSDETGEKFLIQIYSEGPLFPPDHELSLQVEGIDKPRRKRGRPPKPPQPPQSPVVIEQEATDSVQIKENNDESSQDEQNDDINGDNKRRRRIKAPVRYSGAIQGKELDLVFKEEGVLDEEYLSDTGDNSGNFNKDDNSKTDEEVIGRVIEGNGDNVGQPIIVNKNFNRPKFRTKIGMVYTRRKRRYSCEICCKNFLHYGRYMLHKKMHEIDYICLQEDCNFKTDALCKLKEHQESTGHDKQSASEKVNKIGTLQLPNVPQTDSESTSSSNSTTIHYCEKCKKTFTCKQNYEVHIKTIHEGQRPYSCTYCKKNFAHAKTLRLHLLSHKDKKHNDEYAIYSCLECPKKFRHPSSLQYHRDSEHTNGRKYVCNKCDKVFKHRQLLQRHQTVHTEERPHHCSQCTSTFKTRANLIHHTQTVHASQKNQWCNQCGKSFVHKTALRLHLQWHMGLRPYQCNYCHKSFSQKGNLAEHIRIHTGEKPYKCEPCNRYFTTSSQYHSHRKRHSNELPHECEFCSKTFSTKEALKCHIRRHFGDRPFRCQFCGKTFVEGWALKKHERLHTGEKPYICEFCSKSFADSSNLGKHRRTHRNGKNVKPAYIITYEKNPSPSDELTNITNENQSTIETTLEFQQLIDNEGNPFTFTTDDGQQVKVISSKSDDLEIIQGLLPDGTLIPINLQTGTDKKTIDDESTTQKLQQTTQYESQLLDNNIQFISDDSQNMCLVTYNIDSLNPQYLTMT